MSILPTESVVAAVEVGDVGHVPHVYCAPPWTDESIPLSDTARRHLRKVLRLDDDSPISYTDGRGCIGTGTFTGDEVIRGAEDIAGPVRPSIVLAVAPPQATDRARFVVEKAAELAVSELRWLTTRFSGPRLPRREKAEAWAISALEQSRGAHLMRIGAPLDVAEYQTLGVDLALVADLAAPGILEAVADRDPETVAIAIGPEGGFGAGEVPEGLLRVGLGDRVLRVETAAIVAVGAIRIR